ncbi:MAG TPA: alkaline phosphatase family protein [Candidatus Polarisedimenticolaceae bacterium]|nr:alkaline phosphatase family protein [Candidatus Polarisedimenticolaceae bacterium]
MPTRFLIRSLAVLVLATAAVAASPQGKVVILGFDGADARLVEQWMGEGKLPNLAKLKDEGTYTALQPTNPPQTPVSWSSFATGTSPGKTRIFDFLMRNPADYLPDFAMNSESKRAFLFGERNALVVGLLAGAALGLVAFGILLLFRVRWGTRLASAVAAGLVLGIPAGFVTRQFIPVEVPDAINHRHGETMWELASKAGRRVQVIRVPATFPAENVGDGHMLSGLGVPDMRGRVGTPTFYTSDPTFEPGGGTGNEFSLELVRLAEHRGTIETRVLGPLNKPFYDYVVDRKTAGIADRRAQAEAKRKIRQELDDADVPRRLDVPMKLTVTDDALTVALSGQTQTLKVGEWSDWFVIDFPVNWLVDRAAPLKGMGRFKLLKLSPNVELYLSPVNFHPDCHPVAFSWPPSYSTALRKRFGLFKTIGWPEDTWSLPSGVGDENLFLEDMNFTLAKDEEIMKGLLGDGKDDLYIHIFYFTDRIGHLFWRFLDPGHPAYDPAKAARYAPEVLKAYQRMDAIVGEARALAGPDATFIVCSDHGFSSFRRGVNINTWLVRNGFMTLKGQTSDVATLEKLFDTRDLFQNVDWTRTKAYALGLGSIYVNLVGREKGGVVMPGAEYEQVRRGIKEGLEGLVDPETGDHPVAKVWTREEMYSEFEPDLIPDLRAGNSLNYRVSWQTSLGGVPPNVLEPNTKAWSGDHCSNDPSLVRGILFCNKKLTRPNPAMIDLAPTVMKSLGLPVPAAMDGKPLF